MQLNGLPMSNVSDIIHNPVYTGIGPFPRIIKDDLWIKSMARSVKKTGRKPHT